jgi:hypothetical protein
MPCHFLVANLPELPGIMTWKQLLIVYPRNVNGGSALANLESLTFFIGICYLTLKLPI